MFRSSHYLKLYSHIGFIVLNFRRAKDFCLARICGGIVAIFIVCNLPRLAIGGFEVARYLTCPQKDCNCFFFSQIFKFFRIPTILKCSEANIYYFAPESQVIETRSPNRNAIWGRLWKNCIEQKIQVGEYINFLGLPFLEFWGSHYDLGTVHTSILS